MSENEGVKRSRKDTAGLLRRFIAYYRPYKKLFSMDMGAALLVAVIGVVYPIITRTMLNIPRLSRNPWRRSRGKMTTSLKSCSRWCSSFGLFLSL